MKLLHVFAHKADLSQLCDDISPAFVIALTLTNLSIQLQALNLESTQAKTAIILKAL
jgi:hypothetical protein